MIASVVFLLLRRRLVGILNLPYTVLGLMVPMALFDVADSIFKQVYQPLKESKLIAIVMMVKSYTGFGLSVGIILLLKRMLYLGPIFGSVLIGFVFFIYFVIKLRGFCDLSFNIRHVGYIMNYSVPLIPYTLSGYILAQFDRIMINSYKGSDDAGLYSLAYNIGMLLAVVIGSINAAWMPKYFEYLNREQYTDHDRDVDRIFRIILVVAFFLILFGKQIGFILAKRDYHTGLHIVPIVVAGYIFYGLFTIYGRNIGYVKKTIHSSIVLLVSGAVNVVLNAVFIPRYGYVAAAYTTLLSYFIMAVLAWVINRYVLRMYSTPLKIVVVPLVSIIPFIALFYAVEKSGLTVYITLGIKTVLLVVWVFIMLFKYRKDIMSFLRGQETR